MFTVCRGGVALLSRNPSTRVPAHRLIGHRSVQTPAAGQHTPDTYSKDIDDTPAGDKTVHRLDPDSDRVQKPHEPPSNQWSRAGVQTEEYHRVEGRNQPYAPEGGDKGRYGTRKSWPEDKGPETSGER
ncbi:hypothetical protein NLJ89_g6818 [Agrocybe chaxingu]|uniref:Uncharacterized protein n=1 Tax=Agrocybe chaxingu TaxID=84603 RepID=A0A9W8MSB1_9AGAR|nr:hypothetical protein NLJ89_g6818 [Agrocybe chaxingu]